MNSKMMDEQSLNQAAEVKFKDIVKEISVSPKYGQFIHPFRYLIFPHFFLFSGIQNCIFYIRMMIAGPTLSGKSFFCRNLLRYREQLCDTKFKHILYCTPYSNLKGNFMESIREVAPEVQITHGIPDLEKMHWVEDHEPKLVILDDLIMEVSFNIIF